ncbi:hypothetical protein M3O96_15170 [Aquiflexum sp. TKW24L]|uniref:DUF6503 family protein n=1 Tax=Aquiflexum sp. TKW24L TaxID=2942212 RepID=UPI0020C0EC81|nr:DUF6503 family protein [Aquiflexum sp. TKW24L]MCL6260442.1 hypothetical protein [Aquiflexum sp. TKW24L]
MKSYFPFVFLLFVYSLTSCKTRSENKAIEIIEKSIESHGGSKSWEDITSFSLEKETWLYDENGEIESHLIQFLEFRQKPFFETKMTWEKDSVKHKLVYDGLKTRYYMGENEILNEGFLNQQKKVLDAAYYVLTKPFDLLDGNKQLTYEGQKILPTGEEVLSINVIDEDSKDPKVDIWSYYFDPVTSVLLGYKVKTGEHISFVKNIYFKSDHKIIFPASRESYRINDAGLIQFKRADYEFRNYVVK